jgi:hypothetical protein
MTTFSFFLLQCKITFWFGFVTAKKATPLSHHPLLWFRCNEKEEDNNFCHLFQWLYCKKLAGLVRFFGGFIAKKVTTTMSSPSSMVVVM